MILYTVQEYTLYKKLLKSKVLKVDLSFSELYVDYKIAYDWLYKQFKKRVKNYDGNPLWWGYLKRPDLRVYRRYCCEKMVLIELDIPDNLLLKSNFYLWECAICDAGIFKSLKEFNAYYKDEKNWTSKVKKQKQKIKEKSWDIIFEESLPKSKWLEEYEIKWQVNFEYLKLSDVKSVKIFNE